MGTCSGSMSRSRPASFELLGELRRHEDDVVALAPALEELGDDLLVGGMGGQLDRSAGRLLESGDQTSRACRRPSWRSSATGPTGRASSPAGPPGALSCHRSLPASDGISIAPSIASRGPPVTLAAFDASDPSVASTFPSRSLTSFARRATHPNHVDGFRKRKALNLRNRHAPVESSEDEAGSVVSTLSSLDHIDRSVVAALQADGRQDVLVDRRGVGRRRIGRPLPGPTDGAGRDPAGRRHRRPTQARLRPDGSGRPQGHARVRSATSAPPSPSSPRRATSLPSPGSTTCSSSWCAATPPTSRTSSSARCSRSPACSRPSRSSSSRSTRWPTDGAPVTPGSPSPTSRRHPPSGRGQRNEHQREKDTLTTTFLFMPESAYGPTNNCIGIGNVLRQRGHRVVFAAEASWAGRLEPLGFVEDLVDLAPPPDQNDGDGRTPGSSGPTSSARPLRSSASRRSSSSTRSSSRRGRR